MIHTYNFSKGKLTVENVMRELKDVANWFSLGSELKLPKEVLEKQNFDEGGSEVIRQWLKMEGATWHTLATALENVGENGSADKAKKYCKVTCNSVLLSYTICR